MSKPMRERTTPELFEIINMALWDPDAAGRGEEALIELAGRQPCYCVRPWHEKDCVKKACEEAARGD